MTAPQHAGSDQPGTGRHAGARGGGAREAVLGRVRRALSDIPDAEQPDDVEVPRDYLAAHATGPADQVRDLLAENLEEYRAHVHRAETVDEVPGIVQRLLEERGTARLAVPAHLPSAWLPTRHGCAQLTDSAQLTAERLDTVDSVLTGCAVAIAETGTLVLDAAPDQGRRMLTLVPDHHMLVVTPDRVVASVPEGVARLDPHRPLTWISGPSATSDIELNRVEGVHGPRTLDVLLVG